MTRSKRRAIAPAIRLPISLVVCTFVAVVAMAPRPASASEPLDEDERGEPSSSESPRALARGASAREIDGHRFAASELITEPFIDTRFRSETGLGLVRATAPRLTDLGEATPENARYREGTYTQSFSLQVKVLPWVAVRLDLGATILTGVTGRALLRLGSAAQYGGGGGVSVGYRFGRVQLAAIADAQYAPSTSLSIIEPILQSIKQQSLSDFRLLETANVIPFRAGLSLATPIIPSLGFEAEARVQHTFRGGATFTLQDAFVGAAQVDFDLLALTPVPIGALVAYEVQVPYGPDLRDKLWHTLSVALNYTGRPDFIVGLELSGQRAPQEVRVLTEGFKLALLVRYYW
jgi:hypothetical protein